jgi:hypothetical protein
MTGEASVEAVANCAGGACCHAAKGPGYATPLEAMEKAPPGEAHLRHLHLQRCVASWARIVWLDLEIYKVDYQECLIVDGDVTSH